MQLLFGVVGTGSRSSTTFDDLVELTTESNPGIPTDLEKTDGLSVGHHVRSWARWDDPASDLTLLLDGEIRLIDGMEASERGSAAAELATVAALYRQHGSAVWDRLDGSFCLIVRDGGSVRIGFDVAGTRAIYWWAVDGVVAFHARLLDLAPAYPRGLRVDEAGVAAFLADALYPLDATAFEGIRLVGAGQVLEVDPAPEGSRAVARDYFRFTPATGRSMRPIETVADELNDLLESVVGRSWRAAVDPVMPLSGGVDSRYLAAMAARVAGEPRLVQTITWGEEPTRAGSDAVIARQVAATLQVPNLWCEKLQLHDAETVERALYLTSGEGDGVLNYPSEHEIHRRFVEEYGWRSMFRGDQLFGEAHRLLTNRALLAAASLTRIGLDRTYAELLGVDLLRPMAKAQDDLYARREAALTARGAQGRLYELGYETDFRRELAPYNTLKNLHFEVYTPYLDRQVLDWVREQPDVYRSDKRLIRLALDRRFPALSPIPFASRPNVPDWELRARTDPTLAHAFRDLCEGPGWLDTIGARTRVIAALERLESEARASSPSGAVPSTPAQSKKSGLSVTARDAARATLPGKLVREWTMERRAISSRSMFSRLSRLVVVHLLIGRAQARQRRHYP